jgi:hypothetical protein
VLGASDLGPECLDGLTVAELVAWAVAVFHEPPARCGWPPSCATAGYSEQRQEAALTAATPLALPPSATALARLEHVLIDLSR